MQLQALSTTQVERVIALASAAHSIPPECDDDDEGATPVGDSIDEVLHPAPERVALNDYLRSLSPEQFAELVALTWLGRGDAGEQPDDFPMLVKRAATEGTVPNYLASKAPLARYLRNGLRRFQTA